MSFLYPTVLYLLALPLLLAVYAWIASRRRIRKWDILVSDAHKQELVQSVAKWKRILPVALSIIGLSLTIIALARPIAGEKTIDEISVGRNILIAIDVSRSMKVKDASPSRLDRARTAAYDLLEALPQDNFGVIIFSGEASLLIPLTHDHNAVRDAIEQIQYGWMPYGGTNLEEVLKTAIKTYKRSAPNSTNALVILSDGEDTVNTNYHTIQEAKTEHLIVVTAGIGTTAGELIPDENAANGYYADRYGKQIHSKLTPESLQQLAHETGGEYIPLTSGSALAPFVKKIAEKLDEQENSETKTTIPEDRFELFAILALLLFVFSALIGTHWRKKLSRKVAIIALCLFCTQIDAAELVPEAKALLADKKYEKALEALEKESALNHSNESQIRIDFAKAYSQEKLKQTETSSTNYSKALLSENKEIRGAAHASLGNLSFNKHLEKLKKLGTPKPEEPTTDHNLVDNMDTTPAPTKATAPDIEELKKISISLKNDLTHYNDALGILPDNKTILENKQKAESFISSLDLLIKKLEEEKKQQEQDKKDQQQKDQEGKQGDQDKKDQEGKQGDQDKKDQEGKQGDQDKKDQEGKQGDQDKKDQEGKQGDQDKKDQEGKQGDQDKKDQEGKQGDQDKKDQEGKQGDQDKKDQEGKQGDQDKKDQEGKQGDQDKKDQEGKQGDQDKNPASDKGGKQDDKNKQPEKKPNNEGDEQEPVNPEKKDGNVPDPEEKGEQGEPVDATPAELDPNQEEKNKAARILKERADEEGGSPFPKRNVSRPFKDY